MRPRGARASRVQPPGCDGFHCCDSGGQRLTPDEGDGLNEEEQADVEMTAELAKRQAAITTNSNVHERLAEDVESAAPPSNPLHVG